MPPTFLLILLALLCAALSPLVLAGLLIALLFSRWRRPARRVLALAVLAGGLVDALGRLAGLGGEGWLGLADGPFVAACAVFTASAVLHISLLLLREWRRRRAGQGLRP